MKNHGLHVVQPVYRCEKYPKILTRVFKKIFKDTVSADEEHDIVHADDDAELPNSTKRLNPRVHNLVPVLARQNLKSPEIKLQNLVSTGVSYEILRGRTYLKDS